MLILKLCYAQPSVGRHTVSGTIRVPSSALKRYECNGQYDGGYMENLEWLKEDRFENYKVFIYNKGTNTDFYKPPNAKVIKLPNYGREAHTYLYHIVHNYDNLADLNVFLPGSSSLPNKLERVRNMVDKIQSINNSYYSCKKMAPENDFTIDSHKCTDNNNKADCKEEIEKSDIRPFGEWYKKVIGDTKNDCFCINSIFSVTKEDIRQYPRSYYEKLLKEVDGKENPETGHYFERSWVGVFNSSNPTYSLI